MNEQEIQTLLRNTLVFEGLAPEDLALVASVCQVRELGRGEIVFRQGDPPAALFLVAEGAVKIFVTSDHGDEIVLATAETGDVFGELSLIDRAPRSASTQTLDSSVLISLGVGEFDVLMDKNPAIPRSLLLLMASLLRKTNENAADFIFLDLQGRVAKTLVAIAERGDQAPEGGVINLDLRFTRSDLASMVGGARQSVDQVLRAFERRGLLTSEGRTLVIHDLPKLKRRAGL